MSQLRVPMSIWTDQLQTIHPQSLDWIWQGYLARGSITLLTSSWKSGKTTLLSMLMARRNQATPPGTLAGLPVKQGKSVVISEESTQTWAQRARTIAFGNDTCIVARPFPTVPSDADWQGLIHHILDLHGEHPIDLVAIDPLAPFCRSENHAKGIFQMLLPLGELTRHNIALLLTHHPSKNDRPLGQSARLGALLAHVDIALEMRHPGGDPLMRRRRFFALSRFTETPRQLLLEMNADATDYVALPDADLEEFQGNWHVLQMVLEDAPQKLTRQDILDEWPLDFTKPKPSTLWLWLDRALRHNLVSCEGSGRKSDPYRYWLPEAEARRLQNPLYKLMEDDRLECKLPFFSLRDKRRV